MKKNKPKSIFALVDCNNFYVSCERVFSPKLQGRPVVVLSNNDGCIIARSEEAKGLGIAMGTPYFKCRQELDRHEVEVFSSNYALYGDMSRRVMEVLRTLEPEVEIYSIDEAFLRLPVGKPDLMQLYAEKIRAAVLRQTGIPVSVGLGPSRTLAKLAGRLAKKSGHPFNLTDHQDYEKILSAIPTAKVWGIGRRLTEKLAGANIHTALDLTRADDRLLRRLLGITGLRTAWELRGISCLTTPDIPPPRQTILTSRSFGRPIDNLKELREAVSTFICLAAEKLRTRNCLASCLQVFIATNPFSSNLPQHREGLSINLAEPTAHSATLLRAGLRGLQRLYRHNCHYQKAGVMLSGLSPAGQGQIWLLGHDERRDNPDLMEALDLVNRRIGRQALRFASTGSQKKWHPRQEKISPCYTTRWGNIPTVTA